MADARADAAPVTSHLSPRDREVWDEVDRLLQSWTGKTAAEIEAEQAAGL